MIFVGVDWAEIHHDICILDEAGDIAARKRIPDTLLDVRALHEVLAIRSPANCGSATLFVLADRRQVEGGLVE